MSAQPTIDVSNLPTYAFGHRALTWWATWSMILMEGMMLIIFLIMYFFLRTRVPDWPPGGTQPPDLFFGSLNTGIILVSFFPNWLAGKAAERLDLSKVKLWTILTTAFAIAFIVIRAFEFRHLNCRWDTNAYGSIVWVNMGFHTLHLLTDTVDTIILILLMFFGPIEGRRFVDFSENCTYWNFVIVIWLLVYAVIYIAPRLM